MGATVSVAGMLERCCQFNAFVNVTLFSKYRVFAFHCASVHPAVAHRFCSKPQYCVSVKQPVRCAADVPHVSRSSFQYIFGLCVSVPSICFSSSQDAEGTAKK